MINKYWRILFSSSFMNNSHHVKRGAKNLVLTFLQTLFLIHKLIILYTKACDCDWSFDGFLKTNRGVVCNTW
jgi:hypothetical protein